jgi:hypothetical protein
MGEIGGFEFAPAADQHIAQSARLDLLGQRLAGDAKSATDLGLRDQEAALRQLHDPLPEIRVDLGCGGSHRLAPCQGVGQWWWTLRPLSK